MEPVAMEAAEEEEQRYHWSAAAAVVSCQWRSQRWEGQQEGLCKDRGSDSTRLLHQQLHA